MCSDQIVVAGKLAKSVAHACFAVRSLSHGRGMQDRTIVSHGIKVQTHEIGEEECVSRGVPGPISNGHRVGRVRTAPRGGKLRRWRHLWCCVIEIPRSLTSWRIPCDSSHVFADAIPKKLGRRLSSPIPPQEMLFNGSEGQR